MEEIWKDIKNYEGLYQVSNLGRVKSLERTKIDKMGRQFHVKEKILNPLIIKGYYAVWLYNEKLGKKRYTVHRLVAEAFIPNPYNLPQVGHKDENNFKTGDGCNNCVDNLEWTTALDNNRATKRRERLSGENNYFYGKHFKGELHPQYGTHRSIETKEKISRGNKGKIPKNRRKVICDNKVFDSISHCAKYYDVPDNYINRWLKGTRKMPEKFVELGLSYYEEE